MLQEAARTKSPMPGRSESPSHKPQDFTFQSDFDQNGVFYFLGTNGGRAQSWANPADKGLVSVTMVPQPAFSGNKNGALSRTKQRLRSKQRRNPWLAVDLGPLRKLRLNKYSLRHGGHANEGPLRNWEMQGSHDGEKWETLRVHVNDGALRGEYGVASWDVESSAAFRHFRIFDITAAPVQLSIGGLELYGRLELVFPGSGSPHNTPPPPIA
jgi:E3 ubiquitin-protein ligase HECTD1